MTAASLARAAHPLPVLSVTVITTLLAVAAGRGLLMTAVCAAAVLTGHLFVGWTNDLMDVRLDALQGRTDKPIPAGKVTAATVRASALVALAACVPLSVAAGLGSAAAHFTGLAAGTAYNAGLKRTPFSAAAYAVGFAMIPAFVVMGPPVTHPPAAWAVGAAAMAGMAGHFTQVLPDVERDRSSGVRGLPQMMGTKGSAIAAALLLVGAVGLVALEAPSPALTVALAATVAIMWAVVAGAMQGRLRFAFRLTLAATLLTVVALVLAGGRF